MEKRYKKKWVKPMLSVLIRTAASGHNGSVLYLCKSGDVNLGWAIGWGECALQITGGTVTCGKCSAPGIS